MKKLCLIIFSLLLFILCACTKAPPEAAPEQSKRPTQTEFETKDVPDAKDEQPVQKNDGENGDQNGKQAADITPEVLQNRLEHASLCSCLMEQGARWYLIRIGALEETQTDAPFLAAVAAFETALTTQPEQFFTVEKDTLWLLDSVPEGGYALHFLQADLGDAALSCRTLFYDGKTTHYQSEPELLESPHWSSCTEAATDTVRQGLLERYSRLCADDMEPRFWRISMTHGSELALSALSMNNAEADVYYPTAQTHGRLIMNTVDIAPEQVDALTLFCLRISLDASIVDADEIWLLRRFLAESILTDNLSWDAPIPLRTEYSRFYDVKNAIFLLLRDLRADDVLKEAFLSRENWTLSCDGGMEYTLTAQDAQGSLTAHLYAAGVDVEGYRTPSRSTLERLAAQGENAAVVSEQLREQFVLGVLRDHQYGRTMSGEFGEAAWIWHKTDGEIQLNVVVQLEDGTELLLSSQLVTTPVGDSLLSVYADVLTNDLVK